MNQTPQCADGRNASTVAVDALETALNHSFTDKEFLNAALSHRSFVHQRKDACPEEPEQEDNQRLEFLGDAVLSICVSTLLYHRFPESKEGVLSKMRAGMVNEIQLADLGRRLDVPEALFLGHGEDVTGGRDKNSIIADAMEAIIAAVYLDAGFEAAMAVVSEIWGDLIDRSSMDNILKDFKTHLQERVQKHKNQTPDYRLIKTEGPDHARVFTIGLHLKGSLVSEGQGRSKKEAEQAAAQKALEMMDDPESDFDWTVRDS